MGRGGPLDLRAQPAALPRVAVLRTDARATIMRARGAKPIHSSRRSRRPPAAPRRPPAALACRPVPARAPTSRAARRPSQAMPSTRPTPSNVRRPDGAPLVRCATAAALLFHPRMRCGRARRRRSTPRDAAADGAVGAAARPPTRCRAACAGAERRAESVHHARSRPPPIATVEGRGSNGRGGTSGARGTLNM